MSTSSPIPITLVGATGLTGSATLKHLLASTTQPFNIKTIARKAITTPAAGNAQTVYTHQLTADLFEVPSGEVEVAARNGVYVSCLGSTRATAGGFAEQEKIDVGLNTDLARRAKADGARQLILVSSGGTSADSRMPYSRMKGQLEDAVKAMGWESCVILRPGMLLGPRDYNSDNRIVERIFQNVFRGLRASGLPVNGLCLDADDVGAAIAYFAAHPPAEPIASIENQRIIQTAKLWRESQGESK